MYDHSECENDNCNVCREESQLKQERRQRYAKLTLEQEQEFWEQMADAAMDAGEFMQYQEAISVAYRIEMEIQYVPFEEPMEQMEYNEMPF